MIKIEPQRSVDQRLGKGKTLEKIEDQKSEPQMTDGRGQMTDDGWQTTEDRASEVGASEPHKDRTSEDSRLR